MLYKGIGLLFVLLCFSGCVGSKDPRWALLGDTSEKAFFIDRTEIKRLPNGNYHYPIKVCIYQEGQPHAQDDSHDTNQFIFVEMDCRERQWAEAGRSVMKQDNKVLFRHINSLPTPHPIESDTIHFAAYNYLCSNTAIIAQHNH